MKKERVSPTFKKIPATVITGFLGSGKTSLIKNLIATAGGRQLAFIINEFGDLGVDKELLLGCGIENCSDGDIVELANGCICCTVADDFLPSMKTLLNRPRRPDHIIIETSGLALPKPLLKAFTWPEVRTQATVDGVVAVIDSAAVASGTFAEKPAAVQLQREADEYLDHDSPLEELFEEQLQCADIIVLNKCELVEEGSWELIESKVSEYQRPKVKTVRTSFGKIKASVLLGLGAEAELDLDSRPSHHESEDDHDHEDFGSFVIDLPEHQDQDKFFKKLEAVIESHNILRIKGFLSVSGKPMRLAIQAVGNRVEKYFDRYWESDAERYSKLVIIGYAGLDKKTISDALQE
ncbi:MAG: cobalamin biosynthesis protein CobW [Rhodospirillaceae bacterium]|nr:cobalamin biosynthesis protein CobW [Rhodospirillaceae bacterium]|tara:strand:+ start:2868 stop:3920 length:1053 start_codon:yes stop_codon:yes gene_type:complete